MNVADICGLVSSRLPSRYEHLRLTFHGRACRPNEHYVVIGDDYRTDLCVSLSDGAVYAIDPRQELPARFMNSGIEQLAEFLEIAASFSNTRITDSEVLCRQMRAALTQVDPKALATPGNWWAVVLEPMAYGL